MENKTKNDAPEWTVKLYQTGSKWSWERFSRRLDGNNGSTFVGKVGNVVVTLVGGHTSILWVACGSSRSGPLADR